MRIVLVDNLLIPDLGVPAMDVHPHLGLISLAAVAHEGGHRATIFDPKWRIAKGDLRYDPNLYSQAADRILAEDPEVVGFTTLGCSFIFSLKVARYLKRRCPDLPILLGGPHATILHQRLLERFPEFDVVVRHEAEETFLPVLDSLRDGNFTGIPGVTWRSRGQVHVNPGAPTIQDLDSLPFPGFEHYPIKELGLTALRVDAGRGCPFECTFCSTASFFGRNYRLKSPKRLVGELDALHERYAFTDFKLNHDLFTVNKKKVLAFCEAVKDRGYTWGVSARVDCVDEPLLQAMWDAGCRGIYFGIETGSPRMQKIAAKHLDLNLVEPILDVTERLGMRTIVSFIAGYPEENQADQDASLDMLGGCFKRNRESFTTQLHMLTPEPGTRLYEQYGDRMEYDAYITDFNATRLEDDDEAVILANRDVFLTYFFYPTTLPRERHVFAVDAYRILRKAGHAILRYALTWHEGRFGLMVGDIWDWCRQQGRKGRLTVDETVRYFAERFGAGHHLTSLFRYALAGEWERPLEPAAAALPSPVEFQPDLPLQLSPEAHLFKDIHDCGTLLDRLRVAMNSSQPLPNDEAGELGDYLIIRRPSKEGWIENYQISAATHAVLSLFQSPRSYREISAALEPYAGAEPLDPGFFQRLLSLRALTPTARQVAHA